MTITGYPVKSQSRQEARRAGSAGCSDNVIATYDGLSGGNRNDLGIKPLIWLRCQRSSTWRSGPQRLVNICAMSRVRILASDFHFSVISKAISATPATWPQQRNRLSKFDRQREGLWNACDLWKKSRARVRPSRRSAPPAHRNVANSCRRTVTSSRYHRPSTPARRAPPIWISVRCISERRLPLCFLLLEWLRA